MADTTTQIYNQTIYWADFVANTLTLFTTDASTRYVIKDMEVADNTFPSSFNVVVNNTKVASLSGNLTGTEILDTNSTVQLTYDTSTASYISVNCILNTGQSFSDNVTSGAVFYTPSGFLSGAATGNTGVSMTQLTSYSQIQGGWTLNGNFYYHYTDQNSQQALYRRAGGPNGTQSTIYNDSYSPCTFDGVSKFYWVNSSGQLYNYDTATGGSSYLAGWQAGSTYPMLCYVAGYVFYSSCYNGINYLRWYRVSNGGSGVIYTTDSTTPYSSNTGPAAFYNSSTGAVKICLGSYNGFSTSYGYYSINIATGTPVMVGQGTSSSAKSFRYNTMCPTGGDNAIMFGTNIDTTSIYLVDNSMSVISSKVITNDYFSNNGQSGSFQIITPSNPVKAASSPSVRLRVTGVLSV